MKKLSMSVLLLILLAVVLFASLYDSNEKEPVILTMWSQEKFTGVTPAAVQAFNENHPHIQIQLEYKNFDELVRDLIRAFAIGNAPDIIEVDNPEMVSFTSRGLLHDLYSLVAGAKHFDINKILPGMKAAGSWDGKLYAIPKVANTIALFYNADLFIAAGLDPNKPPQTWQQLAEYAEILNDPVNQVAGLSFTAVDNEEGTTQFLPFLQMAGASYSSLDSPGAEKALAFWTDLYQSGNVISDALNKGQWDLTEIFNKGGSAMHISGPWELNRMSEMAQFDWRVAVLPAPEGSSILSSALGGFMHGINAKSEYIQESFEFIDWFHSNDHRLWDEFGLLPGFLDVELEPENFSDAYKTFSEQIKYAQVRGPHVQWPRISKAMQSAVQSALRGELTPKEALSIAAERVKIVMSE